MKVGRFLDIVLNQFKTMVESDQQEMESFKEIGGVQFPSIFPNENILSVLHYQPQSNDLFIITYPKSGTNLVQYLIYLIINKGQPCPNFEEYENSSIFIEKHGIDRVNTLKLPRILKSHIPFSKFPKSDKAKYIYVARNPKDVSVSYFHLRNALIKKPTAFEEYLPLYIDGELGYGKHLDHVLEFYQHRNEPNMLLITYEEMLEDRKKAVIKLAKFLGKEYETMIEENPEIIENIIKYSSVEESRKIIQIEKVFTKVRQQQKFENPEAEKFVFVRKGIVGDWKNYFNEEQSKMVDKLAEEKLGGTELYDYWKSLGIFQNAMNKKSITFDKYLRLYIDGELGYGKHMDHIIDFYPHRHDPNHLLITYEEMIEDRRKAYSSVEESRKVIQVEKVFKKIREEVKDENPEAEKFVFVRKGIVGDWKNNLSEERAKLINKLAEEKLSGTELYDFWKRLGIFQ
ncbi:hypothetical protein LAZ67_6001680 [Cordylochernes scorpioides]|uniref:Sulfotransferase domain-containing protein n=1 Tax=Cordylochernes scorpioides TaxID=51811 RepID=A0ABY6KP66_9ARAC|nr:hypothetical protein LAZ67_6001680 [Cordylochernes scorpioides]